MKSIKKLLVAVLTLAMLCGLTMSTFSVSAAKTLTDNLLNDPGFEVPTEDDLYTYWGPYDSGLVELVENPDEAHEGDKFVKVSERSSSHDCPTQDITAALKANDQGRYYISCWVKFEKNQDIKPDGYPMNFNMTIEVQCSDMNWGFGGKMWYSLFLEGPNGMNDVDEWPAVNSEDTWVKVGGYVDIGWSKTLVNAKWRVFSRTIHTESHDMNEAYTFVMDDCELRKEVEATGTTTKPTTKPSSSTTKNEGNNTTSSTTKADAGNNTTSSTTKANAGNNTTSSTTKADAGNNTGNNNTGNNNAGNNGGNNGGNVVNPPVGGNNDSTSTTASSVNGGDTTPSTDAGNVDNGNNNNANDNNDDANTNTDNSGNGNGGDSSWMIIIIVALAVIIVGGVLIFLLSKKKTDAPAE